MSRRAVASVLGAAWLLAASVAGASSASALAAGATAPASVSFGATVPIYSAVRKAITVTASGPVTFGAGAKIDPLVGQPDDFSVVGDTCANLIIADTDTGTCVVTVEFRPFATGLRQASLQIPTTAPAATATVALSGTAVPDATGTYYGLPTPSRYLDTRPGARVPNGGTRTVQIRGVTKDGYTMPASGISAVVVNLTAVATSAKGFFTLYPNLTTLPTASTINFPAGWTGANMATVPVGTDGAIKVFNSGGPADILVDVLGWYAKDDSVRPTYDMGAQFLPATVSGDPTRIFNSLQDPANDNLPFQKGDWIEFSDTWDTAAVASAVRAYAVTLTAYRGTASGYFTAWSGGTDPLPANVSNVNYVKGIAAPNMALIPAGHYDAVTTGFRVQNFGAGAVHMIVDLIGYYVADDSAGMRFKPLTAFPAPKRILDTRFNVGLNGKFGPATARTTDATTVATSDSIYVVGNTTGVAPTASTWLTVWSGEVATPPLASTLNLTAGVNRAVSTYAPLAFNADETLTYRIYNNAGSTHVLFDAAGTLDLYPGSAVFPVSAKVAAAASDGGTADLEVAGRTVPGASTFIDGRQGSTNRRG
jgi:hypothetical protein